MKTYYTLLIKEPRDWEYEDAGTRWVIRFGDYDLNTVRAELDDLREDYMSGQMRIIETTDAQADIDTAVTNLNR